MVKAAFISLACTAVWLTLDTVFAQVKPFGDYAWISIFGWLTAYIAIDTDKVKP